MSTLDAIDGALVATGCAVRAGDPEPLSGGCLHDVRRVRTTDGTAVVAKVGPTTAAGRFEEERAGLEALAATGTVLVPRPRGAGVHGGAAVLLLEEIVPARSTPDGWASLGADLAALHRASAGERYGFAHDNHLGTTPQPNRWCDDWVEFNAVHRLGHQVRLAADAGRLESSERRRIEDVIDRLGDLLPRRPPPALLHGDLWSGNALPTRGPDGASRVAVIDPACSVGDGWADIAMMRFFGGFPEIVFEAYGRGVDDHDRVPERLAVYQLYHVLNHVNLFGRGYAVQAMALCAAIATG